MSRQIQIRRGDVAANDNFIGAIGEVTMDTTNNTLRVHDGQTLGGTALAKQDEIPDLSPYDYIIEWQMPTAENNYTWYRKYKSGWVEQGGRQTGSVSIDYGLEGSFGDIILPVKMADTNYTALATGNNYTYLMNVAPNTNKCKFTFGAYTSTRTMTRVLWYICGQYA